MEALAMAFIGMVEKKVNRMSSMSIPHAKRGSWSKSCNSLCERSVTLSRPCVLPFAPFENTGRGSGSIIDTIISPRGDRDIDLRSSALDVR